MECIKCGHYIPPGYEFLCLTCGLEPLCDGCYSNHIEIDRHDEFAEDGDDGGN